LGPVANNAGQTVVVAKAKVAKEEETHFFLEGGEMLYIIGSAGLGWSNAGLKTHPIV
jgi:hypothetical protein